MIADHEIIELKTNHIPKGLVPLERTFDNNDAYIKPSIQALAEAIVNCNLGTESDPKFVKVSKIYLMNQGKTC